MPSTPLEPRELELEFAPQGAWPFLQKNLLTTSALVLTLLSSVKYRNAELQEAGAF